MSQRSCQKCLYSDNCSDGYPCRYYLSVDDEDDIDTIIEERRIQFRDEWEAYMNDAEASYF